MIRNERDYKRETRGSSNNPGTNLRSSRGKRKEETDGENPEKKALAGLMVSKYAKPTLEIFLFPLGFWLSSSQGRMYDEEFVE